MRALLKIWVWVLLAVPMAAIAQEETPASQASQNQTDPDIEINLEALEALRPEREMRAPIEPALLPPSSQKPVDDNAPPVLMAPPDTLLDTPVPDSPTAPHMAEPAVSSKEHPASSMAAGTSYSVPFEAGSAVLSLDASDILDKVAGAAAGNNIRLQLFGYAGSSNDSPTATRRLALQRTIAVRGYLMSQGIAGGRIDLRPQGPQKGGGAAEGVLIELLGS